jgi:hypothetical protein
VQHGTVAIVFGCSRMEKWTCENEEGLTNTMEGTVGK